jgi:DNA-binding CsgD family transcriptional regulator
MFSDVSARDVHACYQLVGQCRELGADVDAWRIHLLNELRDVVGAQVVITSEIENFGSDTEDPPRSLGLHRAGWISDEAEARWREYAQSIPYERTPEYPYLSRFSGSTLMLSRDEIWGSGTWYKSKTFNDVHRACGIDDYVISVCRTPIEGRCTTLWLHKGVGSKDFTAREQAIISIVHNAICGEIGGFLSASDEPQISTLTKRKLEVLDLLLRGDSEKQIAYEFGVARATVHEHVLALYRHFNVSSRGELLSKFIGRARPVVEN